MFDVVPNAGEIKIMETNTTTGVASSDSKGSLTTSGFSLSQNYPNPFNPTTTVHFQVFQKSYIDLNVYNLLGEEVSTLVQEERPAGVYDVKFDPSGLTSGIYFCRLKVGLSSMTRKMILVRWHLRLEIVAV